MTTQTTAIANIEDKPFIGEVLEGPVHAIEQVSEKYREIVESGNLSQLRQNVVTGVAVQRLRYLMKLDGPVMKLLCEELMNSDLGFMTDRGPHAWKADNKESYSPEIIRDCAMKAVLLGLSWCGGEFMIFSGKVYITQVGYERKVRETLGLTDLAYSLSPSFAMNGVEGRVIRACASWRLNSLPDKLIGTDGKDGVLIPLRIDKGSTEDNLRGKALRKMLAMVFRQANGSMRTLPEAVESIGELNAPAAPQIEQKPNLPPPAVQQSRTEEPQPDDHFVGRMTHWELKLIEGGLCQKGEFLDYLRKQNTSADLAYWPNDEAREILVKRGYLEFKKQQVERKQRQLEEASKAEAPPDDSGEIIDSAIVEDFRARIDKLGWENSDREFLKDASLPAMVESFDMLTLQQARLFDQWLSEKEKNRI